MLCISLEISYTGHYIKVHTIYIDPHDLLSFDEGKKSTRGKGGYLSLHWVGRFCWFGGKENSFGIDGVIPASKRGETIAVKWLPQALSLCTMEKKVMVL